MKTSLIFLTLISTLALTSCGKLRSTRLGSKVPDLGNIGALTEPPRNFLEKNTEIDVARKICQSLKSKRDSLEAAPGVESYYFASEQTNCQKVTTNRNFIANISGAAGYLEYTSNETTELFTDVITDLSPAIKMICESVLSDASNNRDIPNYSRVQEKSYTAKFYISKTDIPYYTMEIITRLKDAKGSYNISNGQLITIATEASQLGAKFIGVEKERSMFIACNANEVKTMKETWLKSVTSL